MTKSFIWCKKNLGAIHDFFHLWLLKVKTRNVPCLYFLISSNLLQFLFAFQLLKGSVETLFNILGVIKHQLRNCLAIPMVELVLEMRRRGKTGANITILPEIRWMFCYQIYNLKPHADAPPPAAAKRYRAEKEQEQINYDMTQCKIRVSLGCTSCEKYGFYFAYF